MPIITHLMGGLGNQMFQYATGRSLSIKSGVNDLRVFFEDRYELASRQYNLEPFNIAASIASSSELRSIGPERKLRRRIKLLLKLPIERSVVREKETFVFDPELLKHRGDAYLIGFWQSNKYFEQVRPAILKDFTLKNARPVMQEASSIIAQSSVSISVHIRRTDYTDPRSGFSVLPESYYRNALEVLRKRIRSFDVFAFTDDVAWANKNLPSIIGFSPLKIVSSPALKEYEELVLMSQCHHHVIANSSFSWWSAWLNDRPGKIVVAPLHWNGSTTRSSMQDLIPPDWILI